MQDTKTINNTSNKLSGIFSLVEPNSTGEVMLVRERFIQFVEQATGETLVEKESKADGSLEEEKQYQYVGIPEEARLAKNILPKASKILDTHWKRSGDRWTDLFAENLVNLLGESEAADFLPEIGLMDPVSPTREQYDALVLNSTSIVGTFANVGQIASLRYSGVVKISGPVYVLTSNKDCTPWLRFLKEAVGKYEEQFHHPERLDFPEEADERKIIEFYLKNMKGFEGLELIFVIPNGRANHEKQVQCLLKQYGGNLRGNILVGSGIPFIERHKVIIAAECLRADLGPNKVTFDCTGPDREIYSHLEETPGFKPNKRIVFDELAILTYVTYQLEKQNLLLPTYCTLQFPEAAKDHQQLSSLVLTQQRAMDAFKRASQAQLSETVAATAPVVTASTASALFAKVPTVSKTAQTEVTNVEETSAESAVTPSSSGM